MNHFFLSNKKSGGSGSDIRKSRLFYLFPDICTDATTENSTEKTENDMLYFCIYYIIGVRFSIDFNFHIKN